MVKFNPRITRKPAPTPQQKHTQYEVKASKELMAFLREVVNHKSRNFLKGMLARGQIRVQGNVITAYNYVLQVGDRVQVSWEKVQEDPQLVGIQIMYEDEHLLVVDKEAGLLTVATDKEKVVTVYYQLTDYVRRKQAKARIFIVHRLDRDTSGILLFAKNEGTKLKLQENWHTDVKQRTYIAVVEGVCKQQSGKIVSWLKESKSLKMHSSPVPNGGLEAITDYQVIQSSPSYTLVEVNLHTGRKNQIRVHMQDIGHPIVGDDKYGSKKNPIGRVALHAHTLVFKHPATDQEMQFKSEIPRSFLNLFSMRRT